MCSDWFRLETLDDSLQPTIDMLLNLSIFMWFGAVCPWYLFVHNTVIPVYRLIFLGVMILLLRRIPVVYLLHKMIWQVEKKEQALFMGFFGPIGVSSVFYLYISLEFLRGIAVDGVVREDAAHLEEVMVIVIWFLAICSIVGANNFFHPSKTGTHCDIQVVHGLSVPLGKLGYNLPRTLSTRISTTTDEPGAFHVQEPALYGDQVLHQRESLQLDNCRYSGPPRPIFRIGGSVVHARNSGDDAPGQVTNHNTISSDTRVETKKVTGPSPAPGLYNSRPDPGRGGQSTGGANGPGTSS